MFHFRRKVRRTPPRAFRPGIEGGLEERVVMSTMSLRQYVGTSVALLRNPSARLARNVNLPPFAKDAPRWNREFRTIHAAVTQTLRGGKAVNVVTVDGTRYRVQLGYIANTIATSQNDQAGGTYTQTTTSAASIIQPSSYPQPVGVVRAYAMPDGKVGIIVDGSTANTELTINPLPAAQRKGYAHSYAYGQANQGHLMNVGQITVNSGQIGTIEGFHSADLSGPITIGGTSTVDRIAFNSIQPGASINMGGTLNTLDVLQGINLNTGSSLSIGRDLNLLNVGGDINLSNGSQFLIGRDLGAILQPPKGTGSGSNVLSLNQSLVGTTSTVQEPSVGAFIQGGINIGPGSAFVIGRQVDTPMYVIGNVTGASRLVIPATGPNAIINNVPTAIINIGSVTQ
ncbi:hypothetical protein OJF2_13840 [Aquisphaera giovannonii]|uniref:Uncharacterized protein n=1 Tax=Aquisphaera giovannonii TaxID=406548 RepID=A0A5B9VXP9_9BACT|nr:hypothetical protein [Aquisphaera giovannonii]QEH32899.1 hypothetical protein OJF2_13840 [Aquisphaera giovannonii]